MRLRKNRPKCKQAHFLPKLTHNLYRDNSSPKIWATSFILKKLPKKTVTQWAKIRPIWST
jgi:hypothetical protein